MPKKPKTLTLPSGRRLQVQLLDPKPETVPVETERKENKNGDQ